ncbi:AMP-binding protein [Spirochaetia bacterium]|nr:AMP-binding protein [Spirochaetia bacterium]
MIVITNTENMSLGDLVLAAAAKYKKRPAFQIYRDGGVYDRLSYEDFGLLSRRFAAILSGFGIGPGKKVMLLSENRPEWPAAYFGIALTGAVIVPVLTEFVPEQIKMMACHAEVSAICLSEKMTAKIADAGIAETIPRIYIDTIEKENNVKNTPDTFPKVSIDECAAIIYTSGTTGAGKGVMLSHRNLLFTAAASRSLMKIYFRDRLLSVLPLAHTYECTLGLLTVIMCGASVTYLDRPPSPAVLIPAIANLRPTAMVTVPLFIEKIYRALIAPKLQKHFLSEKIMGLKLASLFGNSLRFFGSGGAALAEDVERFLRKARFPYSPGYGLTEAAPLVTGSAPYHFPFRSAGSAVQGVAIRISPEGEIQVKGPNVMMGYYKDDDMTKEAFTTDGTDNVWLKTGDLGYLDKKGFLYIRGRIKALILGPSGENIYPEEIETLLLSSEFVDEALVYAGEDGTLSAFIRLAENSGPLDTEELKNQINKKLPAYSRLGRIEIKTENFEKTATGKIKRIVR